MFRATAGKSAKTNAENAIAADPEGLWSTVVSYTDTIVPTVGLLKPKNFSLQERGIGFNEDADRIISKGRIGSTSAYNTTFKMSYFNPTFLTKIQLDTGIPDGSFESGKYITGATSKAYAVIEGSAAGKLSSGNRLYVKVLSGTFQEGETLSLIHI